MNRFFTLGILIIFAACNTQPKTGQVKTGSSNKELAATEPCGVTGSASCTGCPEAKNTKILIVSIDSVQKNPDKYFDKKIAIQGRVIHTCKVSGKKMFLAGSDEQNLIRVNAGDNISRFDESLQGEIVIVKGVLTPVADAIVDKEKDGKTACKTEGMSKQYALACSEFEVMAKN